VAAPIRWTGDDARAFQQAAGLTNERLAGRLGVSVRTIAYWRKENSAVLPDLAQRALTEALDNATERLRYRFDQIRSRPSPVTGEVDEVLATAAREADADSALLAGSIDPESIDWLWEQSLEIARAGHRPAFETFRAAQSVRRNALELVPRTRHPGTLADLYVISGQASALMASTAFDLNHWDASAALARCAVSYASLAGHDSLRAWTAGLFASLANWRNEPDTALRHFRRAIDAAPRGTPRTRLRYIASRSYALLGDERSAEAVLADARRDQDYAAQHADPLSEETGGEFAFGQARAAACAAAAWLDLSRGDKAAEAAQLALAELTALPSARQSFSQVNGARIDLAAAHLLGHDRDGAEDAIQQVFALPASMRNISLAGRMARVRDALLAPHWADDAPAQQLAGSITAWLAEHPPDFAGSGQPG